MRTRSITPGKSTWCWIGAYCFEVREAVPAVDCHHVWQLDESDAFCACGQRGIITKNFFHARLIKRWAIRGSVAVHDWPLVGCTARWLSRQIVVRYYFDPRDPPNLGRGGIEVFERCP